MRSTLIIILMIFLSIGAQASGWEHSREVISFDFLSLEVGISEFKHLSGEEDLQSGILYRKIGDKSWPIRLPITPFLLIVILCVGFVSLFAVPFLIFKKMIWRKKQIKAKTGIIQWIVNFQCFFICFWDLKVWYRSPFQGSLFCWVVFPARCTGLTYVAPLVRWAFNSLALRMFEFLVSCLECIAMSRLNILIGSWFSFILIRLGDLIGSCATIGNKMTGLTSLMIYLKSVVFCLRYTHLREGFLDWLRELLTD